MANAGQTYYIVVVDPAAIGGTLRIAVSGPAPPPPPPGNDTFAGATTISTLPFGDTLDSRGATTDAVDAEAMAACGLNETAETSVWYAFTPTGDTDVTLDTSGSDFLPDLNILSGSPGSLDCVSGGSQGGLVFLALAGQTYHMQLFEVGTPGSTLRLSVTGQLRPPPPHVALTVNPTGKVNKHTGVATVTGTFTCSYADVTIVDVRSLTQKVGRFLIGPGSGSTQVNPCDDQSHPWSISVSAGNGKFAGGKAQRRSRNYRMQRVHLRI